MIILVLPLTVWGLGYLLSLAAGSPPYEGMLVVLLSALLAKTSSWLVYIVIGGFILWVLMFRFAFRLAFG